ncbi:hypothetical protein EDEG_00919 [Edhazardia aedis USNM 41457]|uniref:C2H2-type domain-containing protein n=1 Tax=Edhazardia aedis (strain USNM 41457) TaxID=1003232 RepID=J9DBS6_EDHAE|nr:hypothetical protein EDEG_00919 [Edhazardia aedis USNM 41457]|eukprot:EJW04944.1 hypothetical protein EDEG_00919 [Edhazardia aedis USNM 41457]
MLSQENSNENAAGNNSDFDNTEEDKYENIKNEDVSNKEDDTEEIFENKFHRSKQKTSFFDDSLCEIESEKDIAKNKGISDTNKKEKEQVFDVIDCTENSKKIESSDENMDEKPQNHIDDNNLQNLESDIPVISREKSTKGNYTHNRRQKNRLNWEENIETSNDSEYSDENAAQSKDSKKEEEMDIISHITFSSYEEEEKNNQNSTKNLKADKAYSESTDKNTDVQSYDFIEQTSDDCANSQSEDNTYSNQKCEDHIKKRKEETKNPQYQNLPDNKPQFNYLRDKNKRKTSTNLKNTQQEFLEKQQNHSSRTYFDQYINDTATKTSLIEQNKSDLLKSPQRKNKNQFLGVNSFTDSFKINKNNRQGQENKNTHHEHTLQKIEPKSISKDKQIVFVPASFKDGIYTANGRYKQKPANENTQKNDFSNDNRPNGSLSNRNTNRKTKSDGENQNRNKRGEIKHVFGRNEYDFEYNKLYGNKNNDTRRHAQRDNSASVRRYPPDEYNNDSIMSRSKKNESNSNFDNRHYDQRYEQNENEQNNIYQYNNENSRNRRKHNSNRILYQKQFKDDLNMQGNNCDNNYDIRNERPRKRLIDYLFEIIEAEASRLNILQPFRDNLSNSQYENFLENMDNNIRNFLIENSIQTGVKDEYILDPILLRDFQYQNEPSHTQISSGTNTTRNQDFPDQNNHSAYLDNSYARKKLKTNSGHFRRRSDQEDELSDSHYTRKYHNLSQSSQRRYENIDSGIPYQTNQSHSNISQENHQSQKYQRKSTKTKTFDLSADETYTHKEENNQDDKTQLEELIKIFQDEIDAANQKNKQKLEPKNKKQKRIEKNTPTQQVKRARGRPPLVCPENFSSDYDEHGIKIDPELGFIGVDDSLFEMVVINGEKEFKCCKPGCTKKFPSLSRVKRHYIVHTGHKPYKCLNPMCKSTFSRRDNMLQHYKTHCQFSKKKTNKKKSKDTNYISASTESDRDNDIAEYEDSGS